MKPSDTERVVRNQLETMLGVSLKKRKLVIAYDSKNKPQIHEFDLVSDDMNIVGEIKSGKKSRSTYLGALSDCFFLTKIEAKKKLLILTDKEFYTYFKVYSEGVIPNNIDVMLIRPDDLVIGIEKTV